MKYTSLFFLILLILIIYFNHKNINRLTIFSLVLFLFYVLFCQQYYEHFDKSLELLDNYSRNPKQNKEIAQKLFINKSLDLDTCYKELIKNTVLNRYKSFYIKQNNDYLTFNIDIDKPSVYLIDNRPVNYPPTKFYINYINKSLNRVSEKEFLCTFNIHAIVNGLEYYLEYNYENDKVLPTLNKAGTNQTWVLKYNKSKSNFNIKTLDGRFLAKGIKKIDGRENVIIKNLPDNTCDWILTGIENRTCITENNTIKPPNDCCPYLVEHNGKCITSSNLPTRDNTDNLDNSPISIEKQGVWMKSFNKIWNGFYSSYLTNPISYINKNTAIQINLDNFQTNQIFSKGKIIVPMRNKSGKTEKITFTIDSYGSNMLSGSSLDKKYNIQIRMLNRNEIRDTFKIPLSQLKINNRLVNNLENTTIVNILINEKNKIDTLITPSSKFSNIINIYSFKMTDYNMDKNFISIFEAINSVDKTLL